MSIDIDFYNKNGYHLLKNFFSPKEIEHILLEAKKIFYSQFVRKGYVNASFESLSEKEFNDAMFRLFNEDFDCLANCGKQAQHLISLHRLSLDERIISLLHSLGLSSPSISTRPVLYFNHPKLAKKKVYHTVDAHQDWRSMQGSLNAVVIWLPLVDINRDLGALEVIPGSHLWGLRAENIESGFGMVDVSGAESSKFISVELKRGDAMVFSSFLVHQSGNNITDSPRWSCHFRYNDLSESSFIGRGFPHAYIYKPIEEMITPGFPKIDDLRKIYPE
jgi:ectoine hydroxylase-related dioxygenase (phytanoyl-CoA dioxygenase family)